MPTPNFTASPGPPTSPPSATAGLDYWFDTTNSVLNVWTVSGPAGRLGWLPMTVPANFGAVNASAVSVGPGPFAYIPAVVGSLGASVPGVPVGQVGLCYDVVGKRIYAVASGGLISGSVLFA